MFFFGFCRVVLVVSDIVLGGFCYGDGYCLVGEFIYGGCGVVCWCMRVDVINVGYGEFYYFIMGKQKDIF